MTIPAPRGLECLYCTACSQRLMLGSTELTEAERWQFSVSEDLHTEAAILLTNRHLFAGSDNATGRDR